MNNNELNEKLIKYLINNKDNYSDTYFYNLGKRLPVLDRIILINKLDEETEQRIYYFEKRYKKEKELLIKNK